MATKPSAGRRDLIGPPLQKQDRLCMSSQVTHYTFELSSSAFRPKDGPIVLLSHETPLCTENVLIYQHICMV